MIKFKINVDFSLPPFETFVEEKQNMNPAVRFVFKLYCVSYVKLKQRQGRKLQLRFIVELTGEWTWVQYSKGRQNGW